MRSIGVFLLALAVLAWAAVGAVSAQTGPGPRLWQETFDWLLELGGASSSGARVFTARGRAAMLLSAPDLPTPLVIDMQQKTVRAAVPEALHELPEGEGMELPDEAVDGPPAPYTMDGDAVIFYWNGKRVKVARKPPLIGEITLEALLARLPIYRKGMEAYEPPVSDVSYLKTYARPVTVHVFFGSWCPHCRQIVPRFLKSIEVAANGNIQLLFTGVPSPFTNYEPAKEKQVKGVPTFIVFAENREIGRFSAIPQDSSPEHELVKILYAHAQGRG
jgi:thiol-disulfide isomerase/thioredoxin